MKRVAIITKVCVSIVLALALCASPVEAKTKTKKSTTPGTATAIAVPAAKDVPAQSMHAYVQAVIAQITTPDMTNDQKLAASYNYVLSHMTYKRDMAAGNGAKIEDYALEAFFTGQGNCYRYASMFAYMAKELGYDAYVCAGECTSNKGGMTPHSWVVIIHPDGRALIYDGSFGDSAKGKKNYFGITEAEHSRKLVAQEVWKVIY